MKDVRVEEGFYPSDLKDLSVRELDLLCDGIRAELIESVSACGGHLASNLGVVELTVALHRVFDAPRDRIVWDVGHQSYVHKMLTGRGSRMGTLRQYGGLSGFPKRSESIYDTFDTGHSSNSISAALGMAAARDLNGDNYHVIAVIGDGAMTGGMVYEALNNAGFRKGRLLIILNDNGMSISPNRGSLSQHLSGLRSSDRYIGAKDRVKDKLGDIPLVGNSLVHGIGAIKDAVKYTLVPGVVFEELGLTYLGPVDGHNLEDLISVFEDAREMNGPVIIHCVTKKGKGYRPAERHPDRFHGIGPFDRELGVALKKSEKPDYSAVFGKKLREMARRDERIVAVSAAMIEGTGLAGFAGEFPERTFDVGIAEEHAVTFAAGMATSGKRPFVAIYSTFMQRAYDQMLIDVCMQKLPVVFCLDRAGVVGADGETHQGIFDISYMSHMPNLTILAPSDESRLRMMMEYALEMDGPVAIRYPRGEAADLSMYPELTEYAEKKERPHARILRTGSDVTLAGCGSMTKVCLEVSELLAQKGIECTVIDAEIVRPLSGRDRQVYRRAAQETGLIVTVEDNVVTGGYGSLIEDLLRSEKVSFSKMGWPDAFVPHGSREELMKVYGLDAESIAGKIEVIQKKDQ